MFKFIQVTLTKEYGGISTYLNVDHIISVVEHENETHITVAHLNTTIKVVEPVDVIMNLINE